MSSDIEIFDNKIFKELSPKQREYIQAYLKKFVPEDKRIFFAMLMDKLRDIEKFIAAATDTKARISAYNLYRSFIADLSKLTKTIEAKAGKKAKAFEEYIG
ncbi:MAG: hypothetical protein FJZ11_03875 [Candidatus Omnitrophica bacterium]|nr:hypothetical protein [Candidatus Omnitrophota bacterium]